jgi:leucyl aminopeptidase
MNFELKPFSQREIATVQADALILAVPDGLDEAKLVKGGDALWKWVGQVLAAGELESGTGKLLVSHRNPHCAATRLVLVRVGKGSAADMRKAVLAAAGALRFPGVAHVVLFAGLVPVQEGALRAAALAAAEATYAYTTTVSKPKPRKLETFTLAASDSTSAQAQLKQACALVKGIELAKVFGATDGHKFVNGVLDKLAPVLRAAEVKAAKR